MAGRLPTGMHAPGYAAARSRSSHAGEQPRAAAAARPPMAGTNATILPEHRAMLNKTKSNTVDCVPDYRNRLTKFIIWLKENYSRPPPDNYAEQVVYNLSADQMANKAFYHKSTQSLRFELLNPEFTQAFLSQLRERPDGRTYSFDHVRKFHDAILYCAKLENKTLPTDYGKLMGAYLATLKKEKKKEKSLGKMDEKDADAIPFQLYKKMNKWCVDDGNIMAWAFTTTQWNVMGRCVNVSPLGFHNLTCKEAQDSVVIEYDKNKVDQTGESTSPKNIYANPHDEHVCWFLAMGCYLAINDEKYNRTSDKIFQKKGKDGSSGDTYCKALKKLINSKEEFKEAIIEFCRWKHFHPHGTRKGSATHVTTGTMDPPPIPSVLLRGEWSLGKVLDLYWKWSKLGDTYLGRCLAGLDPDDEEQFGTLPPHFKEGVDNKHVKEALHLCFGTILSSWSGECAIQSSLLLFLASIVYHSEWLLGHIADNSAHPFQTIPIIHRPDLLQELKKLVTLEPTVGVMTKPTGVPYRIVHMNKVKGWFKVMMGGIEKILDFNDKLPEIIKNSIDEKAASAGHVTVPFVMAVLEQHTKDVSTSIGQEVRAAVKDATQHIVPATTTQVHNINPGLAIGGMTLGLHREYTGGFAVPLDFAFPAMSLRQAWEAWLIGFPNNRSKRTRPAEEDEVILAPVRPLRYMVRNDFLPKINKNNRRVRQIFADNWKPVLSDMHDGAQQSIGNTRVGDMNALFMESTYYEGRAYLKEKYPTLFDGDNEENNRQWKVSTWSKNIMAEKRRRKRNRQ